MWSVHLEVWTGRRENLMGNGSHAPWVGERGTDYITIEGRGKMMVSVERNSGEKIVRRGYPMCWVKPRL